MQGNVSEISSVLVSDTDFLLTLSCSNSKRDYPRDILRSSRRLCGQMATAQLGAASENNSRQPRSSRQSPCLEVDLLWSCQRPKYPYCQGVPAGHDSRAQHYRPDEFRIGDKRPRVRRGPVRQDYVHDRPGIACIWFGLQNRRAFEWPDQHPPQPDSNPVAAVHAGWRVSFRYIIGYYHTKYSLAWIPRL